MDYTSLGRPSCPRCGKKPIIHSSLSYDKPRYKCKSCRYTFTEKNTEKKRPLCPECMSNERVKRNGNYNYEQRYLCKKCEKTFRLDEEYKHLMDESKARSVINSWLNELGTYNDWKKNSRYSFVKESTLSKMIKIYYKTEYEQTCGDADKAKELLRENRNNKYSRQRSDLD